MIVTTTRCRFWRMVDAADDEGHGALVDELIHYDEGGDKPRSRVKIEICYAAGVKLRELMIRRCYKDDEMMRRGLSSSEFGALQDLAKATNEELCHPAMRGVGMIGHTTRIFHVWEAPDLGPGFYHPMPNLYQKFLVLKPYWHVDDNYPSAKFTLWDPKGFAPESRFDDESLHWQFV